MRTRKHFLADNLRLNEEVAAFARENQELRQKIQELKPKAENWDKYHRRLVGMAGEELFVRDLVAERVFGTKDHDLRTDAGLKLEVKLARLSSGDRWKWNKLQGRSGQKQYDRLLLVGERNPCYSHLYDDPESEHVIFDLSAFFARMALSKGHATLNSNPENRKRSQFRKLMFEEYQVTWDELRERYGPPLQRPAR